MLLTWHGTCHGAWSRVPEWPGLWATQAALAVSPLHARCISIALYLHFGAIAGPPPASLWAPWGQKLPSSVLPRHRACLTVGAWWVFAEWMNLEWIMSPSNPIPSVIKYIHVWGQMAGVKNLWSHKIMWDWKFWVSSALLLSSSLDVGMAPYYLNKFIFPLLF